RHDLDACRRGAGGRREDVQVPGQLLHHSRCAGAVPPRGGALSAGGSHYRSPINYSEDNLKEAKGALERLYRAIKGLPQVPANGGEEFVERFGKAMDDDFNTPEACAVLFDMAREVNRLKDS